MSQELVQTDHLNEAPTEAESHREIASLEGYGYAEITQRVFTSPVGVRVEYWARRTE